MLNRYLFLPFRLSQAGRHLVQALRDPRRKPLPRMLGELASYGVRRGDPAQYLYSFLYRKGVCDPCAYLSHHQYRRLRELVTRRDLLAPFTDKLEFQRRLDAAGLPQPVYLGHTQDGTFHGRHGEVTALSNESDAVAAFEALLKDARGSFFAKPTREFGGKGAFKMNDGDDLNGYAQRIADSPYLFQEVVTQHPALAAFHPASLNSIRVLTCMMRDGSVHIVSAQIKFGQRGSVVDNSTSGGLFAGVDLESGRLSTDGIHSFRNGGAIDARHPDSGLTIKGFEIPMFSEVLALAHRVAQLLPYPLIGWDIAVTPDGPLALEGNANADYFDDEIIAGPHRNNAIMRSFIEELTDGRWL